MVTDNPGVIALEDILQLRTDKFVKPLHVVRGDALAVRGIGDQHTVGGGFGPGRQRLCLQLYHAPHTRALDVLLGNLDSLGGNVGAVYLEIELLLVGVVIIQTVKQLRVEVAPVLE